MNAASKSVHLAYGKTGLDVVVPEHAVVIEPKYVIGVADERAAIIEAIRNPIGTKALRELVRAGQTVAIVHTDITRATPNNRLLPPILAELESAGIRRQDISLLNALGTHRRRPARNSTACWGRTWWPTTAACSTTATMMPTW